MLQGKYPLIIALVLGLMAGLIAYSAIKAKENAVRSGWAVKRVLCAAKPVEEGSELTDDAFTVCEIPEKFVTESFIPVGEDESADAAIPYGQKLIVPLKKGDPILYSHFESRREFPIAEAITPRYRAISIDVNEKSSVDGLVRPNDHVDVVGTFRSEDGKDLFATTVLQNIIVLATGRTTGTSVAVSDDDKKYNHVALLVLPEEAEILSLAAESGSLSLALRNPTDIASDPIPEGKVTSVQTLTSHVRQTMLDKTKNTIAPPVPKGTGDLGGITVIEGNKGPQQYNKNGQEKKDQ